MEKVLGEHLRCPICFEFPEAEVYQCKRGHSICKRCSHGMKTCPQCRVPFEQKEKIRNLTLEALLETREVKCTFKARGCNASVQRKNLKAHCQTCEFGIPPVRLCKLVGLDACNFSSSDPSVIFRHIVDVHPNIRQLVAGSGGEGTTKSTTRRFLTFVSTLEKREPYNVHTGIFEALFDNQTSSSSSRFVTCRTITVDRKYFSYVFLHMGKSQAEASNFIITCTLLDPYDRRRTRWKWIGEPTCFMEAETVLQNPPFQVPLTYVAHAFGGQMDFDLVVEISVSKQKQSGGNKV